MRRRGFAVLALVAAVVGLPACSGSPPTKHSTSSPASASTPPPGPTTASSTATTEDPGPPKPVKPTVPADVPTTGPNIKPGEKPPVMPLEATQHTARGAKAFAEFFIKTIDWGYATTSSAYMKHYFAASCIECANAKRSIDDAHTKHRRFIGDRFHIRTVGNPRVTQGQEIVEICFDVTAGEIVDSRDKFVNAEPAHSNFRERLHLAWQSNHWLVTDMDPRA